MKTFSILEHPTGQYEAIKKGWCWPGFFLGWFWALYTRQSGWAVATYISGAFVLYAKSRPAGPPGSFDGIQLAATVVLWANPILFGVFGNAMRRSYLYTRGFEYRCEVTTFTPDQAIAEHLRDPRQVVQRFRRLGERPAEDEPAAEEHASPNRGGYVYLVLLLVLIGVGYHYLRKESSTPPPAKHQEDTSVPSQARAPSTPHPAKESRAQAVRLYPALGQQGSPLNEKFLTFYRDATVREPELLAHPDWPIVLATRAAASLDMPSTDQIKESVTRQKAAGR